MIKKLFKSKQKKALESLKELNHSGEFNINEIQAILSDYISHIPPKKLKSKLLEILINSTDFSEKIQIIILSYLEHQSLSPEEIALIADIYSKKDKITRSFSDRLIRLYQGNYQN